MRRPRAQSAPQHLLDTDADQNIGNGTIVQPQAGGATVIPQTNPERILMLSGPSGAGQTMSIALTASRIVPGPNNLNPGFPGPITGIIEFGNGGQTTRVEVDIPIGPFVGLIQGASPAIQPEDGGVIVTVPTGVLRVYARYDNLLIQPLLNRQPPTCFALANSLPFVGPGGPVIINNTVVPAEPVLVKAMVAYFSRHTSKVYRTHYIFVADDSMGMQTGAAIGGQYCVPAFARSVRVLRQPATAAIDLQTFDNNYLHILNEVAIPSYLTEPSPVIPLGGTETIISVGSHAPADKVVLLALQYEIGI
jgi:hypothetical protein